VGDKRLRQIFDEDAELYDRARPGYPPPLFADLAALAGTGPGCQVLELGCGTGRATVPLAEQGCAVTAIELGANMADVARRNLRHFPAVRVEIAAFEEWPLPREPFDLVLSATAFHWLDPDVRVTKSADALRPGGALAVISTHHVAGGDEAFFAEIQACYERWDPNTAPGFRSPRAADVPDGGAEIEQSGRFGPVTVRRYEWELTYPTSAYLDLLRTYSNHRALPPEALAGLLTCIRRLADDRHGGQVRKAYLTELLVARSLER